MNEVTEVSDKLKAVLDYKQGDSFDFQVDDKFIRETFEEARGLDDESKAVYHVNIVALIEDANSTFGSVWTNARGYASAENLKTQFNKLLDHLPIGAHEELGFVLVNVSRRDFLNNLLLHLENRHE